MKNSKLALSTLFTTALLLGAPGVQADKGHSHSGKDAHHHDHAEPAKPGAVMTSHDGMTALYKQLGEMKSGLDAGKLESIHDLAENMGASVKDLDKDTSLTAERKKRVQGYVKNVIKLADRIHHSADNKKLDQAKKDFGKLQAQVDLLDKQFAHSHKPGAAAKSANATEEKHHLHDDKGHHHGEKTHGEKAPNHVEK